jgi:CheY-like chemotaxis protein
MSVRVLVIEEEPEEAAMLEAELKKWAPGVACIVKQSAISATEFLDGLDQPGAVIPQAILLSLPTKGHFLAAAVLVELKRNTRLRSIPVIVLTDSADPHEVAGLYNLRANCIIPKAEVLREAGMGLRPLCEFWFGYAILPKF